MAKLLSVNLFFFSRLPTASFLFSLSHSLSLSFSSAQRTRSPPPRTRASLFLSLQPLILCSVSPASYPPLSHFSLSLFSSAELRPAPLLGFPNCTSSSGIGSLSVTFNYYFFLFLGYYGLIN